MFADHGPGGAGEPLAVLLRPGNAGSNTAADYSQVRTCRLRQLPAGLRRSRQVRCAPTRRAAPRSC